MSETSAPVDLDKIRESVRATAELLEQQQAQLRELESKSKTQAQPPPTASNKAAERVRAINQRRKEYF